MKTQNSSVFNKETLALIGFIAVCLGVSAVGGAVTSSSVEGWYHTINKPAFNPPNWIFAPVWLTLFIFMAIAGWRVWKSPFSSARKAGLGLFGLQLVLNLTWSILFFGFLRIDLALIDIALLLVVIVATMIVFWKVDRYAGILFVPYVLWVAFATFLNLSIWVLNSS
jgi:tryptophan-rich sensory protein